MYLADKIFGPRKASTKFIFIVVFSTHPCHADCMSCSFANMQILALANSAKTSQEVRRHDAMDCFHMAWAPSDKDENKACFVVFSRKMQHEMIW